MPGLALPRTQQVFSRLLTFLNECFTRARRERFDSPEHCDRRGIPSVFTADNRVYSHALLSVERNLNFFRDVNQASRHVRAKKEPAQLVGTRYIYFIRALFFIPIDVITSSRIH